VLRDELASAAANRSLRTPGGARGRRRREELIWEEIVVFIP
jgi:hypothetical protein